MHSLESACASGEDHHGLSNAFAGTGNSQDSVAPLFDWEPHGYRTAFCTVRTVIAILGSG